MKREIGKMKNGRNEKMREKTTKTIKTMVTTRKKREDKNH
jgi:hypothetical protein